MSSDSQEKSKPKVPVDQSIDRFLFDALQNINIEELYGKDITLALPSLAKLLLNPAFLKRHQLLRLLYPIKKMNDVVQLMLSRNIESYEASAPITTFESCSYVDKLKIVAIEYMRIQECARQSNLGSNANSKLLQSDLFDNRIYLDDISYCLYVLLVRATTIPVFNILDMTEALLHIKFGSIFILRLVANMPDRCQEVCHSLVTYGERQDEGANFSEISEQRAKTLRNLCQMNPSLAFTVRSLTIQMCKLPSLTIMITLDNLNEALNKYNSLLNDQLSECTGSNSRMDVEDTDEYAQALTDLEDTFDSAVAFVTGILLGVDDEARTWFAQYTKSAQQKRIDLGHYSVLSQFRTQILAYMDCLFSSLLEMNDLQDGRDNNDHGKNPPPDSVKFKLNARELNRKLIRATATLRLFCAFRSIGSLKLNSAESDILLRLITCKPAVNQTSVNFATTGVCTLLACSALINNQKEERRAAEWLKWLIMESNYSDAQYSHHGKCPMSELLLLIAIHFQNNQNNQIAELVCSTLGMKLHIKNSVSKCKSLFVQEVFFDKMVAEHAIKVPVTKHLNDNIKEFLPVHCIHQLLENRSFSKHQVAIKDWIFEQICQATKPIHNIMPHLIEAYVNSVIIPTSSHGYCGVNQAISEESIARVFRRQLYSIKRSENSNNVMRLPNGNSHCLVSSGVLNEKNRENFVHEPLGAQDGAKQERCSEELEVVDVEASQVLLLYYLLLYEDVRLRKNVDIYPTQRAELIRYNADFMMDIPVFYLLQLARDKQSSFGAILPDLLKLVTSQYPQLCSLQHWLTIEHYDPQTSEKNDTLDAISNETLRGISTVIPKSDGKTLQKPVEAIKENLMKQLVDASANLDTDHSTLSRIMTQILVLPKEEIWPFVDVFIDQLSRIVRLKVISSPEYKKLIKVATKLWWKFNTILPRKLWVMTVNSLIRPNNVRMAPDVKPVEHSWDELALDPLIVLRCDCRVFRCVDTLNIIIHILNAFLAASRRCLQDQIDEQPSRQKDTRNLEELRATLILAQTSAAIQILLESCMPSEEEQTVLNKQEGGLKLNPEEKLMIDRFNASINCICEHLHQVFIADTNLAKLVHFQTYSSDLLSTTSDKIPSMHICLDFIPELLSQPDLSKQVFVIELTSHLCEKYAITKSLNVAKLCFNVAYTLLQLLPSERRALFFIPVLPALLRICKVFPILREDADIILTQINQISVAHLASTSSRLSLGSARPFDGLEKMSWKEAKKLMGSLSLHEALYLCINKCSLDL